MCEMLTILNFEFHPLKMLHTIRGNIRLSGWRGYPHSNITQTTARLFASANSHSEPCPQRRRRRIYSALK